MNLRKIMWAVFLLVNVSLLGTTKKIYISPGYSGNIFAADDPIANRDNCLGHFIRLREVAAHAGYELHLTYSLDSLEDFEYLIVFEIFENQLPSLERYPKEKLILFLWEPPSVLPSNYNREFHRYFSKVFTWRDDFVDNEKYFKFYYPLFSLMIDEPVDFYSKRLCTLINANKWSSHPDELYSERLRVIDFFENNHSEDFELYGIGWPRSLRTYQGPIERKSDILKYYKFSFTYENIRNVPGYVSEKIFDCFHAGTVPIYLGANNITDYVPKNCFIDRRDFADEESLYQFLKKMDAKEYQQYLGNIRAFLLSEKVQVFSPDNFIRIFMNAISTPPSS